MSTTPDTTTTAGKIAVMQAFSEGAKIDYQPKGKDYWANASTPIWDWDNFDYRIAAPDFTWPSGYTVHNPANVESVGEGWRFLSTVEVNKQWVERGEFWRNDDNGGWDRGSQHGTFAFPNITVRVPITHPFPALPTPTPEAPKPAEATPDAPEGMLPFDLEKALAGVEVVTRDGRLVTDLAHFPSLPGELKLAGVVSRELVVFLKTGKRSMGLDSSLDLFLLAPKPKTETRWVNVYELYAVAHPTRERAEAQVSQGRIACIPLTFTYGEGL